jgi:hypothetical protein
MTSSRLFVKGRLLSFSYRSGSVEIEMKRRESTYLKMDVFLPDISVAGGVDP